MYYSLGGDGWNTGANPGADKGAGPGAWLSGLNYCDWDTELSGQSGSYNQLVCDEFGNVLNLNLRECIVDGDGRPAPLARRGRRGRRRRRRCPCRCVSALHRFPSRAESNNMVGEIPPEIGALVYLTSYISFFNAQSGPIPTALGLIAPLRTFDVESNAMDGNLFQPEYCGPNGLTEVEDFRASLNNFKGNVPTEIGQWTKLQNLWFADNEITGTLPTEIGNLANMSE